MIQNSTVITATISMTPSDPCRPELRYEIAKHVLIISTLHQARRDHICVHPPVFLFHRQALSSGITRLP